MMKRSNLKQKNKYSNSRSKLQKRIIRNLSRNKLNKNKSKVNNLVVKMLNS